MSGTNESNEFKRLASLFTDNSSPDNIDQSPPPQTQESLQIILQLEATRADLLNRTNEKSYTYNQIIELSDKRADMIYEGRHPAEIEDIDFSIENKTHQHKRLDKEITNLKSQIQLLESRQKP